MAAFVRWASVFLLAFSFSRASFGQMIRLSTRLEQTGANMAKVSKLQTIEFLLPDGTGNIGNQLNQQTGMITDGSENKANPPCLHSSSEEMGYPKDCPKQEIATSVEFPPQCCSFPFTLDGQLHYQCVPRVRGLFGCFIQNRIWVSCAEPADFVARNQTVTLTVPLVARFTSTSVHNWIVWQQRILKTPFNQSWEGFKVGFGRSDGNYWLGLETVHRMTKSAPYKLRIEFMLQNGSWYSAEYDTLQVESESENYKIEVGGYSGDLGDVMNLQHAHNGMFFSTYDRDNDRSGGNCAVAGGGGWWYQNCAHFNLNGIYGSGGFGVHLNGTWSFIATSRMMLKK